jgi:ribosomal protein L16 Arg81 hydroxylase
MKKKVMLLLAVVMVLGSIKAMAANVSESQALDEKSRTDLKIAATQIDDMKIMIEDIIEMQERADILFGEDGTPRVGHLYKLAAEADVIYVNAMKSTSANDVHTSWLAVKALKKSACGLVPGYSGCK